MQITTKSKAVSLMILTLVLWLASLVSPGWVIISLKEIKEDRVSMKVRGGIFYFLLCTEDECVLENYNYNHVFSKDWPFISVIILKQIGVIKPVVLCLVSLIMFLVKPRLVRAAKACLIVAELIELFLIFGVSIKTFKLKEDLKTTLNYVSYDEIKAHREVKVPYSVILAGIGALCNGLAIHYTCLLAHRTEGTNRDRVH